MWVDGASVGFFDSSMLLLRVTCSILNFVSGKQENVTSAALLALKTSRGEKRRSNEIQELVPERKATA